MYLMYKICLLCFMDQYLIKIYLYGNVSRVNIMSGMFYGSVFNQNISMWNVSNVTNINSMFMESPFNQDISNWNVSNVTTMKDMFMESPFNQDISNWNVSNVEYVDRMFEIHNLIKECYPIGMYKIGLVKHLCL